jgi:hypothetical protein
MWLISLVSPRLVLNDGLAIRHLRYTLGVLVIGDFAERPV